MYAANPKPNPRANIPYMSARRRTIPTASFAALCGVSPSEASSGRTTRHRLNRGGNRQANNALWRIAVAYIVFDIAWG